MIIDKHPDKPELELKAIGYWRANGVPEMVAKLCSWRVPDMSLPDPKRFIGKWASTEIKKRVVDYVKSAPAIIHWMGSSTCRLKCPDPSDRVWAKNQIMSLGGTCLSDGTYVWPAGFYHYLDVHDVIPPSVFIEHVLAKSDDFFKVASKDIRSRFGDGF